jgi:holo-[acyl-carrier protein] synthase
MNIPNERGGFVVGHGLDVVDLADFARLLIEPARSFLDRHFTDAERADSGGGVNETEKLAGRFAVKEAVMKALGVGWGDGVAFTDVEVVTLESGAPTVLLRRKLIELQQKKKIGGWLVSVSHTGKIAIASVIAVGDV